MRFADAMARTRRFGVALAASRPARWVNARRRGIAIVVLAVSVLLVGAYLAANPGLLIDALSIGWANAALLGALYSGVLVTHFGILQVTVRLSGSRLPAGESFLLTIYSTVANFFGPLQSGPGIRAVYLKSRIGLRFRDYVLATGYYFFVFGVLNGAMLFVNTAPWLSVLVIAAGAATVVAAAARMRLGGRWRWIVAIALVTVVQLVLMTLVFGVEIAAVATGFGPLQVVAYSGSANLALFVSITPGAIGIREAFLVFAQGLHGVPVDVIIAAGIVDRAFYALFLGVLFAISSTFHLRRLVQPKGVAETVGDALDGE